MSTIIDHITDYKENQLLTETSLNASNDFLEQQECLTRFGFTNTGIINGLNYTVTKNNSSKISSVEIENGFGSSIDGYFMHHNYPEGAIKYTKCKPYKFTNGVKKESPENDKDTTTEDKKTKNLNILSQPPFEKDTDSESIDSDSVIAYELLPSEYESKTDPAFALNTIPIFKNPLIVLFLELKNETKADCSPISCDDGGEIRRYRVVPLLMENYYYSKNGAGKELFPMLNNWISQENYIRISRLYNLHDLMHDFTNENLQPVNEYATFFSLVTEVNKLNSLNRSYLTDVLEKLFKIKKPYIDPSILDNIQKEVSKDPDLFKKIPIPYATVDPYEAKKNTTDIFSGMNSKIFRADLKRTLATKPPCPFPCQYYFDFCADLELAVNEFVKQYNLVNNKYYTTYQGRYRRCLVLGQVENTIQDPYRYYSIHFFDNYSRNSDLKKLSSLYERIFVMINKFKEQYSELYNGLVYNRLPKESTEIKIIPSKCGPSLLGERAIPFYYKRDGDIERVWRGGENHIPLKININNYDDKDSENFLDYNINENNFFRIEGIIGTEVGEAHTYLTELCRKKNAPFNILCLDWTLMLRINQVASQLVQLQKLTDKRILKKDKYCIASELFGNPYLDLTQFKLPEQGKAASTAITKRAILSNSLNKNLLVLKNQENYNFSKVPFFWGMEHIGGVYKGGTYILVYITLAAKHVVIADFQVPYMLELQPYCYTTVQACPPDVNEMINIKRDLLEKTMVRDKF